jgi:hypothetical protein
MKATVGRIVHYQAYGTPGGEFKSQPRAAIVAEVHDDEAGWASGLGFHRVGCPNDGSYGGPLELAAARGRVTCPLCDAIRAGLPVTDDTPLPCRLRPTSHDPLPDDPFHGAVFDLPPGQKEFDPRVVDALNEHHASTTPISAWPGTGSTSKRRVPPRRRPRLGGTQVRGRLYLRPSPRRTHQEGLICISSTWF